MAPPPALFDAETTGSDYEELVAVQDPSVGLQAVIVLHSTVLGPAHGGIRRMAYQDEGAMLRDAMGLARSMSLKCALAELPAGGGKAVVLDHDGLDVPGAYRALGRAIERLDGRFLTGPDVGTGAQELDHVRQETDHVNPPGNDANRATARGVLAGLRAVMNALDGDPSPQGQRLVVQGLGGVGMQVARELVEAGAEVLGADVDDGRLAEAREFGVHPVEPEKALSTPCDVLVPCAIGGVITEAVAAKLPARAVCGSANNQLASPGAGERLHDRGILYAPDLVVNAGAVIEGMLTFRHGASQQVRERARAHIEATEQRLADLIEEAQSRGEPPEHVAQARAVDRLSR